MDVRLNRRGEFMTAQQVGIFFIVDGQILMDAVPLAKGELCDDFRGHGGHYDFWEALAPANALERAFKERAYDAYPRGRVIYFNRKAKFVLYADRCIKQGMRESVARRFGLTNVTYDEDEHYQCADCNPYFLD